jgi:hypothetical protein
MTLRHAMAWMGITAFVVCVAAQAQQAPQVSGVASAIDHTAPVISGHTLGEQPC